MVISTRGLYIHLYHLHGLFRSKNLELGRDADTGGQTKYVLELASALGRVPEIERVDVLTRRLEDPRVDSGYGRPTERIGRNVRIVRIRCGGPRYMRKELLWPHLDEFVDNCTRYIRSQRRIPDLFHAHYPDAGYVATQLSRLFEVPLVYTGHSLGRSKLTRLIAGGMSEDEADRRYRIRHRIEVEEMVLRHANLVITSTAQERDEQYGQYATKPAQVAVVAPGIDVGTFRPYTRAPRDRESRRIREALRRELGRFCIVRSRPMVLALSRPDRRKNIPALVRAYGSDPELRGMANLAIFAGIRKDIRTLAENEREVLTDMLMLMDSYDLYGRMAIPKRHDFATEVPELYRIAARSMGVFVNPALTEPFGLTLIEAAASGLPVVATHDGGPQEILEKCGHGILVDPADTAAIAGAIKEIVGDRDRWREYSRSGIAGVRRHYTWDAHTRRYVAEITKLHSAPKPFFVMSPRERPIGRRVQKVGRVLITEIDKVLIGDDESLSYLIRILEERPDELVFGVATGRTVDSVRDVLATYGLPTPDLVVSSVGAEIHMGSSWHLDRGWLAHISDRWSRERIAEAMAETPGLELQEAEKQRPHKLSYYVDPKIFDPGEIKRRLADQKVRYNAILSAQRRYLDFLPHRASKGRAIRYLALKWDIPHRSILVCGASGNDREMLVGRLQSVVVANYSPELETLRKRPRPEIYFSPEAYAAGVIDGLRHFGFLDNEAARHVRRRDMDSGLLSLLRI